MRKVAKQLLTRVCSRRTCKFSICQTIDGSLTERSRKFLSVQSYELAQVIMKLLRRSLMVRRFCQFALVLLASVIATQAQQPAPAASPQAARPQAPKTHLK